MLERAEDEEGRHLVLSDAVADAGPNGGGANAVGDAVRIEQRFVRGERVTHAADDALRAGRVDLQVVQRGPAGPLHPTGVAFGAGR